MYAEQANPAPDAQNLLNTSIGASSSVLGAAAYVEMDLQLFNRLLKVHVIKASPSIKPNYEKQLVQLDQMSTVKYLNGQLFAAYMLVLQQTMETRNQDFAITADIAKNLKEQGSAQARLFNWNFICQELEVSRRCDVTAF